MPSPFAELEDRLSAAVDAHFGEDFVHLPMMQATPNSRREPDASRSSSPFVAVIDDRNPGSTSFARLGSTSGGIAHHGGAPQFTTSQPKLFVEASAFASEPVRLDRIQRVDTGDVYEITNLAKDGQGRLVFDMVKVAKA